MFSLASLIALPSLARAQVASSVEVLVQGVRGARGVITVSLCTRGEYEINDCRQMRSVPAVPSQTLVTFDDAPVGHYAIVVFHDLDHDGHVARGLFGVPK